MNLQEIENLQQIAPDIFISAQITIENIKTLAQAGFKTIICNRPDQEDPNQPDFSIIKAAAHQYGIKAYHIPIVPPTIKKSEIETMKTILKTDSTPLLAYCRHGTRSIHLYRLACLSS
ncbi:TIGR01244 family protein [Bartonella vinsonii subsp. arupensis Pm136co]|uniref:TIGR01244 family protein n=1 Tax=Bartonella vinsonii subsp. arupensis Pm136co TaxID=1094561 RepID=A0ABP2QSX1_BARVI|nr:TIGR01244 family sulfur transferase [Bartonella vinsonii]EJF98001.1 TIGR01244 family protein [Bartonella vinsonii subsp. arupensis Pm136co]